MPTRPESLTTSRPATAGPHRASGPGAADIAAVAIGGGLGSLARDLLSAAFPAGHGFPWAIFTVNVSGCFLLGLLTYYLLEVWPPRRSFLAVRVLGGYTTFSIYAAGVMTLLTAHAFARAGAYALSSVLASLVAVWAGLKAGRVAATRPARSRRAGGSR